MCKSVRTFSSLRPIERSNSFMPYYRQLGRKWVECEGRGEVPIPCHCAGKSFSSALVWLRYSPSSERLIPGAARTYCTSNICNPRGASRPRISHCEFKATASPATLTRQRASDITCAHNPVSRSSSKPKTARPGGVRRKPRERSSQRSDYSSREEVRPASRNVEYCTAATGI